MLGGELERLNPLALSMLGILVMRIAGLQAFRAMTERSSLPSNVSGPVLISTLPVQLPDWAARTVMV